MIADNDIARVTRELETAFAPFKCKVEVWDYKQKLRFQITDSAGKVLLERSTIILREISAPDALTDFIETTKAQLPRQQ